jgi:hypothetical protein
MPVKKKYILILSVLKNRQDDNTILRLNNKKRLQNYLSPDLITNLMYSSLMLG